MLRRMGKKIFTLIFFFFCLSKPVDQLTYFNPIHFDGLSHTYSYVDIDIYGIVQFVL